jgi:signal transduction histidine kinase
MKQRLAPLGLTWTDVLLPAVLVLAGCVEAVFTDVDKLVAVVTNLLVGALLVGRRRLPVVCAIATCLVLVLRDRLGVPDDQTVVGLAMIFTACYALGRYAGLVSGLLGLAAFDGLVHLSGLPALPSADDVLWVLTLTAGPWLFGRLVLMHARSNDALAEQARKLVIEQRQLSERLVADERRRIARELHDIIAHSLSVMVVQAGAADDLLRSNPTRAEHALTEIQRAGRSALGETGRLLHLLREDSGSELDPQPTAADLTSLVEVFRSAGLDVDLVVDGSTDGLPASVDLSIFRIVQEGLTNALKHAPGGHVHVALRRRPDGVDIELRNAGGRGADVSTPSGRGLIGMRERVAVFGGDLDAGPTDDGDYRVRAHLPLPV